MRKYDIKVVMTKRYAQNTYLDRLAEFVQIIDADFYININGDEPLIDPRKYRKTCTSANGVSPDEFYFANADRPLVKNPVEVVDNARIKIVKRRC